MVEWLLKLVGYGPVYRAIIQQLKQRIKIAEDTFDRNRGVLKKEFEAKVQHELAERAKAIFTN
jgi:hypothetical protein